MICERCGARNSNRATVCSGCGNPLENLYGNGYDGVDMPMKWYKFLTFFFIWFEIVLLLADLFSHKGTITSDSSLLDIAIKYDDTFRAYNAFSDIVLCGLLAFAGYSLLKYKRNAPNIYMITYIIGSLFGVINVIWVPKIIDLSSYYSYAAIQSAFVRATLFVVAYRVLFLLANKVYFDKRKHLFTN